MSTKTKKNNFDLYSIKTVTMMYFLMFALILILLINWLQTFFLDNYYQQMKTRETSRTANTLEAQYLGNKDDFSHYASQISMQNGVFIRVDDQNGSEIFNEGSYSNQTEQPYDYVTDKAKSRLDSNNLDSVSMVISDDKSDAERLVYATYLGDKSKDAILYIVAPLYPVQSTISIIRQQLLYICLIAMLIAMFLALLISKRLASPIEDITKSAEQLSRGNFNVKFNGGMFTETNKLAKTLNTASYELEKTDYYQRDLIANVSHDLKTPLTMIRSYAEMINDISGDDPVKRKEHLHIIISETERLNKLVTDMLSMSRLQSNSLELNKVKFDLTEAAHESADTFKVLNDQEGYRISFNNCKPTYVVGDIDKIKQVMNNLISNAVKYCGDDKYVRIDLKRVGKKIRFDVVDHGEGIASDEINHVWERYYRTSANHNRDIEGTGLGLSIVKGILSLHNADYGVESKEGSGSDFWFEMDTVRK